MRYNLKYTKENLTEAVLKSKSIADVLRNLDIKLGGGSHSHISRMIKKYNIRTDHFLGQSSRRGTTPANKKHWTEVLTLNDKERRLSACMSRRALIESGRPYSCEICGLDGYWNDLPITLEVDHKNSCWQDNTPDNLRFLCPNCHSQTHNKKPFKIKKPQTILYSNAPKACQDCGQIHYDKSVFCPSCRAKNRKRTEKRIQYEIGQRRVKRPSLDQLLKELNEMSCCEVGRKYGVSDNAIRKWIKFYQKMEITI